MGGSSYDRDVYSDSSSSSWGASSFWDSSSYSCSQFTQSTLHDSMNPCGKILQSNTKHPIIVMLDVTGSNGEFARIVYDKLPMFYGQIEQKGYLHDFDISFCAVGDAYADNYPLQVGDFAKGIELDSWIKKIVLEGGGGGQMMESYELAAYYLYKNTEFVAGSSPIIFFIGDEKPYPKLSKSQVKNVCGINCYEANIKNSFELLRKKVKDNVFMLLNKYSDSYFDDDITTCWESLLAPEHVIKIGEKKAIIDLMLGIISMLSSKRTLKTYKVDMLNRGQTHKRITSVAESLKGFSTALVPVKKTGDIAKTPSQQRSTQKGKRL